MKKVIASKPADELASPFEQSECAVYSEHICKSCWELVYQPAIKGIWIHSEGHHKIKCLNLIPIKQTKINTNAQYHCEHDFEISYDIIGVKCRKCGVPFGPIDFDHENSQSSYHCKECDKHFAILNQHYKNLHKKKIFPFRIIKEK